LVKGILILWLSFASSLWAQEGTANRSVILRRDPSTAGPVVNHLALGARVTLVDVTADSGFFHVKTEDDQVGWVWSKFITVADKTKKVISYSRSSAGSLWHRWTQGWMPGYSDTITLPPVGSHAQDAFHAKWMETRRRVSLRSLTQKSMR
jgi:uncharacterized protein YgiM (DUF1202 family)